MVTRLFQEIEMTGKIRLDLELFFIRKNLSFMSVLENSLSWLDGFNEAVNDSLNIREKLTEKDDYS